MKKVILFMILACGSYGVFAQGFAFGIKAGVNIAKEKVSVSGSGSGSVSTDSFLGFHGGVYGTVMFAPQFGLQGELLYSLIGGKGTDDTGATDKNKTGYITIPVLFRYQIVPLFNIHTGPQLGFCISAKDNAGSFKDQVKGSDLGWAFGAGVDLPAGLNFSARYVLGLTNITKGDNSFQGVDFKTTNQVIQLTIGYKLFGKKL